MTPEQSAKLIEIAGGDMEFAALMGLPDKPGTAQRVNNWKRRGIPTDVILANYQTIKRLEAKASRAA